MRYTHFVFDIDNTIRKKIGMVALRLNMRCSTAVCLLSFLHIFPVTIYAGCFFVKSFKSL